MNRAAGAFFQKELNARGLPIGPGQQAYLLALQPGEQLIQDELAARLLIDKANVTRAIAALEEIGYIQREHSTKNRRQRLICLSPAGIQARQIAQEIAETWITHLSEDLTHEEWDQLEELTTRVAIKAAGVFHKEARKQEPPGPIPPYQ